MKLRLNGFFTRPQYRRMLAVFVALFFPAVCHGGDISGGACTFQGIPLYGKVRIVHHSADIKIQEVDAFPDLKVQLVSAFPNECGEWQIVESFPDFTVEFVQFFPDIKVQFVESFPGIP